MSTQKDLIKNPKKAEAIISKGCGWEIEFLSGGYESFTIKELIEIAKTVSDITGKKQWLNLGTLKYDELRRFKPYIDGYIGTLECVNPKLRNNICPSKPMDEILETFKACDELGLQKGVTVIIGLGEKIEDFHHLEKFIKDNGISRITFYSLNPQEGTEYTESPSIDYYEKWIIKTRKSFPKLHIVAGAWHDKTDYYGRLLKAGADNFTKFPVLKMFGTDKAKEIAEEVKKADRKLVGTLTELPEINIDKEVEKLDVDDDMKLSIKTKAMQYMRKMLG